MLIIRLKQPNKPNNNRRNYTEGNYRRGLLFSFEMFTSSHSTYFETDATTNQARSSLCNNGWLDNFVELLQRRAITKQLPSLFLNSVCTWGPINYSRRKRTQHTFEEGDLAQEFHRLTKRPTKILLSHHTIVTFCPTKWKALDDDGKCRTTNKIRFCTAQHVNHLSKNTPIASKPCVISKQKGQMR